MKTITLQFDYLQGAIWISNIETGEPFTGISFIDNDETIRRINYEMANAYSSYYEFDGDGGACRFNQEKQKAEKEKMLEWLSALKNRLHELNDRSFQVEDLISPEYETL